jgi:magnesium transporter
MPNETPSPDQRSAAPGSLAAFKSRHPRDIAEEIRDLPLARIREILRELPDALTAEVISHLPPDVQVRLFESMQVSNLSGIVGEMFSDDAADVLGHVSAARLREIMSEMPPEEAGQMSDLLKYPEDTAGGIMQTEVVSVPEDASIAEALALLRRDQDELPNGIFYIYVTDAEGRLRGVLRVRDLLFSPSNLKIRDIMEPGVRAVSVHADQEEIARLYRAYGFSAIPVVDDFQRLRGVVTADDVLEVVEEEATEDMQRMVGLSGEEAAETPWMRSVRNRLPWLCFNLATAFLAGWVVSLF